MTKGPVKLRKDLTYKNIFGKEKKVMSAGHYVELEDILARVSFRGENYIIPVENIEVESQKYELHELQIRINKAIELINLELTRRQSCIDLYTKTLLIELKSLLLNGREFVFKVGDE